MELRKLTEIFQALFQSCFSIVKIILLSKFRVKLPQYKSGEECVILGNGPCLTKDFENNLDFILARKKMCVNLFAFSDEYIKVKPDYYVLAAPEFWMSNPIEFHLDQRTKLAKAISEKTNWQMKLFIPFEARNSEFCRTIKSNPQIDVVHFNQTPVEGFSFITRILFKMNLGMPRPHNVLIPSIFLALNLGYKKIILFGADHSWHEEIRVDKSNNVTIDHQHHYEKKEVRFAMYKLDGQEYHIHDVFRKLYFAFKGYFLLRDYAESIGSVILNASYKSYIDAFKKISLSETK